jgi:hypothetical protein
MQPGCLMKILEAERWLKGTNFREVAFLQRRQDESNTGAPPPGARKVEWRDAWGECEDMVAILRGHPPFKGDSPHLRPQPSWTESSPTRLQGLPPTTWGLGPTRHASWPRAEEAKPPRAERVTAQRLQALLHFCSGRRVKGWTAMQAACNRTKGAHPFDSDASSMGAQAHTSCNRRAGYYVRETAPPLAPVPHLLDCGTDAATRDNPAHGPIVPTERIGHGSVSRGEGAMVDMAKSGPAVMAAAGERKQRSSRLQAHVPSWDSERALSHGVKTTCPCSIPRTARARTTANLRTTRLVALTLRQDRRHLW